MILPPSIFALFLYRYFYYIFFVWRHEFPVFFAVFAESLSGSFVWCNFNIYVYFFIYTNGKGSHFFFLLLVFSDHFSFLSLGLVLLMISSGAWTTSEKCMIPIQIICTYLRTFYCHSIMCEGCNSHIYEDKVVAGASMPKWARVCQSMHGCHSFFHVLGFPN